MISAMPALSSAPEQCGSVGHDQILSAVARQLGKFIGRECDSELGVEDYVASIVVLDYARIDVAADMSGDVSKWARIQQWGLLR